MATYTGNTGQYNVTTTPSGAFPGSGTNRDVDNIRRTFGIGDKVAELAPETSIFFSYLSKLGKKPTDETVWKPLEYRNQWQRRNFECSSYKLVGGDGAAITDVAVAGGSDATHVAFYCDYTNTGAVEKVLESADPRPHEASFLGYAPIFLTKNQIVRIDGVPHKITAEPSIVKYTGADAASASGIDSAGTEVGYATVPVGNLVVQSTNTEVGTGSVLVEKGGQVIGSQWGEATGAPEGWRDELSAVEFYTQIFKTSVPLMSGSMMATKYRGYANEWKRIYAEHLKSHKMDLENAFLFGHGKYVDSDTRSSWGIVPFIENKGGKKYELDFNGTSVGTAGYDVSAPFSYDGMVDVMDDFMNWEGGNSGQKLCLTSRKVINALHKVGSGTFLKNSFGTESDNPTQIFSANLEVKSSSFMPIDITSISTSWGSMNFIAHPLFRNDMENKCACIDLSKVSLRPLSGNGVSRDTFVETNVQDNDIDGRKDMIVTEAGLEVMLPECHAVIDFVSS